MSPKKNTQSDVAAGGADGIEADGVEAAAGTATRRRGAELERALLDAAWEELQSSGYARLTMERVAERAGTSRAVIYRRWRNRAELVIAAMRHRTPVFSGPLPDTGALRGDVLAILRRAAGRIADIGPGTVIGMLSDLLSDDEAFNGVMERLMRGGGEVLGPALQRAAERGELRDGEISPRVMRLPLDLLRHELILTQRPPSEEALEEIVDAIFLPLVLRPRA